VNALFLGLLARYRERTLKYTDSRVRLTNEILQGIRSIKSYAWEPAFLQQVIQGGGRKRRRNKYRGGGGGGSGGRGRVAGGSRGRRRRAINRAMMGWE
jgi:hypothetical protein